MSTFDDSWRSALRRPLYRVWHHVQDWLLRREERVRDGIRHVHGPAGVNTADHEMVVLSLVRNGALWVRAFIEHHLSLGATHIFFLDNASTDDTLDRIVRHERVSAWTTDLPFEFYEHSFRRWLTRRFGWQRWALHADIDELWQYPHSDRIPLSAFLEYLDHHGYGAVVAQMVDMFSDRPFDRLDEGPDDWSPDGFRYYDLSDVERRTDVYWINGAAERGAPHFCTYGGVRKRFFGSSGLMQTKHPLAKAGNGIEVYPYDGHFVTGARLADVSTALLHYKLVGNVRDSAADAVQQGQHSRGSLHYGGLYRVLRDMPDLCLRTDSASELRSVDDLVDDGLLTVSARYRAWVESHATV